MAKKLRKMLGKVDDPSIVALMGVIETQSKETLSNWAMNYVENNVLEIYEKSYPDDKRFRAIINTVRECLNGTIKLKDAKPALREANQIAREADEYPAAQAAARATATACSVIQTPTGALGFTFYTSAAIVYDREGLEEKADFYDLMAEKELEKILQSLQDVAIVDEKNPVKIKWNC